MDNLILKDELRVSDSTLKGFVVMTREDGTVIFKKNNMIVEGGRNYIKNLVYGNISGTAEIKYIETAKFGYGTITTAPEDTDLAGKVGGTTYLYEYLLDTTTLVWSDYIAYPYTFGATLPTTGMIANDRFVNTTDSKIYVYSTSWDLGTSITIASSDPVVGSLNAFYFNNLTNKLYIVEPKIVLLPSHLGIGIKLNIILEGGSVYESTSELGLFLDDNTLFSRIVFDPIPITSGFKYRLTYYIYF